MRSFKLKLLMGTAFCVIVTALLAQDLPDTHTPDNFLFDRQSRVVAEYIDVVLKRGDAADLIPAVSTIHAALKSGSYSGEEREVIEVNLLTLISSAEGLIRGQEYADKMTLTDEQMQSQNNDAKAEWLSDVNSAGGTEETPVTEENYTPPEHDKIYNEKKKDLLEVAYEMLETIRSH